MYRSRTEKVAMILDAANGGATKTKHPKFATVVEGISNLDLKETVKAYLGAEVLQKLFKYHAKNLVEEQVATATQ